MTTQEATGHPFMTGPITITQAAAVLGVHHQTVRRWIRDGDLPAYRVGARSIRIDAADLERVVVRR